jgi:hypothetical protein
VVPVNSQPRGGLPLRILIGTLLFAAAAALVVTQIRHAVLDPERHLDGLVNAIAVVWVLFSMTFYILSQHQPSQVDGLHTRVDALYFTASTLLTIGYGDIHAAGQAARVLILVQMLFDVVFVAGAAGVLTQQMRTRAVARASRAAESPRPRWPIQRKPR